MGKVLRRIGLLFGRYNLREEGRRWCIEQFGEQYGEEFVEKYDSINSGIPIGGIVETVVFLDMVETIKSELDSNRLFKKEAHK